MSDFSNEHQATHSAGIDGASNDSSTEAKGTMVIFAPERARAETPKLASASVNSSLRFRLSARAAMVVSAAAIGGLAGSLATAGISRLTAPGPEMPSYYSALAEGLGRVDHELMMLKSAIENATKATDQQVAEIAERLDRTERAQLEAGAKSAKAADSTDPTERRFAAASGEVTAAITAPSGFMAAVHPTTADTKQPPPAPIVEGWVVRDVYHGAALIQGRAGMIEVFPGDNLPGLGRIQQVRRQDGRWVVVTSRGQIVSR